MPTDDTDGKQSKPWQFKPGQSGNPAGKPKGSRSKLGEDFIRDLHADWQANGVATIARVRDEKPADYVKVVASLLPKDVNLNVNPLGDIDDGELAAFIATAREAIALAQANGAGAGSADSGESASSVSAISQAASVPPLRH